MLGEVHLCHILTSAVTFLVKPKRSLVRYKLEEQVLVLFLAVGGALPVLVD